MSITLSALQQQRRDTAANWTSANPTLLAGEIGVETDTGLLKIGDGSTAWSSLDYLPLSFEGYAANGIYNPAANQVALATNGTGRLFIDSSGNIGVGTASPGAKLHVSGDAVFDDGTNARLTLKGTTSAGQLFSTTTGFAAYEDLEMRAAQYLFKSNGTSELVRIDSSGNVGIGVSTISEGRLVIKQNADTSSGGFALYDSGAGSTFRIWRDGAGNNSVVHFDDRGTTNIALKNSNVGVGTTSPSTKLQFGTSEDAISWASGNGIVEAPTNLYLRSVGGSGDVLLQTSGGNVGIGTGSVDSSSQLHIKKTGANAKITLETDEDNDCYINFSGATSEASIGYEPTSNSIVFTNPADGLTSNERMRIDSSGNVGIGKSSPQATFHVKSDSTNTSPLAHNYPATQSGALFENTTQTTGTFSALTLRSFNDNGYAAAASIICQSTSTNYKPNLLFTQRTGSGVNTERMRINDSGRVGIGTSSPGNPLHVYHGTQNVGVLIESGDADAYIAFKDNTTSSGTSVYLGAEADDLTFYTSGSERMRIDSSGNVGIGTTSPVANLEVEASGATSVIAATSNVTTTGLASRLALGNSVGDFRFTINMKGGGGEEAYLGSEGNFPIYFQTHGTERMRILSGGGLTFNGDTAQANALDDYEEGTWVPTVGGTSTYSTQQGSYIKIGKFVHVTFYITISAIGTGSTYVLSGLPFAADNYTGGGPLAYWAGLASNYTYISAYIYGNTNVTLYGSTAATATLSTANFLTTGSAIQGSLVYRAA